MYAMQMRIDGKYKLADGAVAECLRKSEDGRWMIVSPPGEYDLQSCYGVSVDEEVTALLE